MQCEVGNGGACCGKTRLGKGARGKGVRTLFPSFLVERGRGKEKEQVREEATKGDVDVVSITIAAKHFENLILLSLSLTSERALDQASAQSTQCLTQALCKPWGN